MKSTNLLITSSVALFLVAFGHAASSDPCNSAMDTAATECEEKGHRAGWYEKCYEDAKTAVRTACITNNPLKQETESKTSDLITALEKKAENAKGPALVSLAITNRKLSLVNTVLDRHREELTTLKHDVATAIKDSHMASSTAVKEYENSVNSLITRVNATTDVHELMRLSVEIEHANGAAVSTINDHIRHLTLTLASIDFLESRMLDELGGLTAALKAEQEVIDLGTQSNAVTSATRWMMALQAEIFSKTKDLVSTIDQKMSVSRAKEIKGKTEEELRRATFVAMSGKYLSDVQKIIHGMGQSRKSNYYGLAYLTDTLGYAAQLAGTIEYCGSPGISPWQKAGCTRALSYAGNVERIRGSSTMSALRFGQRVFSRSLNPVVTLLNAQLHEYIALGDIEGGVMVYDSILANLEN